MGSDDHEEGEVLSDDESVSDHGGATLSEPISEAVRFELQTFAGFLSGRQMDARGRVNYFSLLEEYLKARSNDNH